MSEATPATRATLDLDPRSKPRRPPARCRPPTVKPSLRGRLQLASAIDDWRQTHETNTYQQTGDDDA